MTIKKEIVEVLIPVISGLIMFFVSVKCFETASPELHIILSMMTAMGVYLRSGSINDKHELLKAIKEGGCKNGNKR